MLNKNYPGNELFTITLTDLWYFSICESDASYGDSMGKLVWRLYEMIEKSDSTYEDFMVKLVWRLYEMI